MRHVKCVLSTSALRLASITKNILKKKCRNLPAGKLDLTLLVQLLHYSSQIQANLSQKTTHFVEQFLTVVRYRTCFGRPPAFENDI